MKAVVHDRYGPPDVMRLEDVDRPVPREGEVLVKVRATTVTRSDAALRAAKPFLSRFFTGLRRPKRKILGTEFAGEVEAVGDAVTEFGVGDRVFGASIFGAHAEFVRVRESGPISASFWGCRGSMMPKRSWSSSGTRRLHLLADQPGGIEKADALVKRWIARWERRRSVVPACAQIF